MLCPYCAEKIQDTAIVCRYCKRDLVPSRALIEENAALRAEIEMLRAELGMPADRRSRKAPAAGRPAAATAKLIVEELAAYCLLPILLLLVAHFLIIVLWDRPTVYLRIVSILMPMGFGFVLVWRAQRRLLWTVAMGSAVSVIAIAGMLVAMHVNFGDAIWPTGGHEAIEDLQYFTSIALAYITGGLIAVCARSTTNLAQNRAAPLLKTFAPLLAAANQGRKLKANDPKAVAMIERALRIQRIVTGVVAAATTAVSIYTGVTSVLS